MLFWSKVCIDSSLVFCALALQSAFKAAFFKPYSGTARCGNASGCFKTTLNAAFRRASVRDASECFQGSFNAVFRHRPVRRASVRIVLDHSIVFCFRCKFLEDGALSPRISLTQSPWNCIVSTCTPRPRVSSAILERHTRVIVRESQSSTMNLPLRVVSLR